MNKRFVLILAVFVVAFAGLLIFNKRDNPGSNGNSDNSSNAQLTEHKVGAGTSGVTLVEYGDFECPACGQYYPLVKQVKAKYGDQITFQFRHFPLTNIHKNALIAARAAEAADKQGKFWEMHDTLYEQQQSWKASNDPSPVFESYAQSLGLDVNKFKEDMKSEEINDIVQADLGEAKKQGYSSTPTFILDGKKIEQNPRSLEDFFKLIDEAIEAKKNNQ
jgi:protein-disulfide isomerase